jgi:hypothetical protein
MAKLTNTGTHNNATLGQYGSKLISGTGAVGATTGYVFVAIQAIEDDFVLSAATRENTTDFADLAGRKIVKGQTVYGRWTSLTGTASDYAIAYMAPA